MTIKLGDKVRDTISGFAGILTGRYEYLNGCVRMQIEPDKVNKDGNLINSCIFDAEQVELVKAGKVRTVTPTGGPRPDPAKRANPSR